MCILLCAVKSRLENSSLWGFYLHIKNNIQQTDKKKMLVQCSSFRRKQTAIHKKSQQNDMNAEEIAQSPSGMGIL